MHISESYHRHRLLYSQSWIGLLDSVAAGLGLDLTLLCSGVQVHRDLQRACSVCGHVFPFIDQTHIPSTPPSDVGGILEMTVESGQHQIAIFHLWEGIYAVARSCPKCGDADSDTLLARAKAARGFFTSFCATLDRNIAGN